jgi:hypothetical protein
MKNSPTIYRIHYGTNTSYQDFRTWTEAARFIKHLLDNGDPVRSVGKIS